MKKNGFATFLLGLSVGAILGILYAPKSGEETRKTIVSNVKVGKELAMSNMNRAKDLTISKAHKVKNTTLSGIDRTRKTTMKKIDDAMYDINSVAETVKDTITLYTGANIEPVEGQKVFEKEF